jgi:hypothetical protein
MADTVHEAATADHPHARRELGLDAVRPIREATG